MVDIFGLEKVFAQDDPNNQIKRPWPVDISRVLIVGDMMKTNKTRTQKSVTFKTFAVFGVIVACMVGIAAASEFNEGFTFAHLPENTHVCAAEGINEGSINLIDAWVTVIEKLIAWQEHDGPELTPSDHELGYALTSMGICGTFNQSYDVSILIEAEGYILFRFDPRLYFGTYTYITPNDYEFRIYIPNGS